MVQILTTDGSFRMDSHPGKIVVSNLSKVLEGRHVLKNVSLTVEESEYFVLLGPSGAGKSSLLRLLAGHGRPTEGEILLCGSSADGVPPAGRPTSLMFQEYSLFDHLTNWQNIVFPLKVRRTFNEANLEFALTLVARTGLSEEELKKKPQRISGGERQRVALLRALVWRPRILLLDEPLASIDPSLRSELRVLLKELTQASGVTTVHVTHSIDEAFELASRVGVLLEGQLIQVGTPREIYLHPAHLSVAEFLGYICVRATASAWKSYSSNASAATFGVAPEKLRSIALVSDGPRITGTLRSRIYLPGAASEHLLIDFSSPRGHLRTGRVPAEDGDSGWQIGQEVVLSCNWADIVAFDSSGLAVRL